jgi:glycosyltransferase involved in cell wall biosynthesis
MVMHERPVRVLHILGSLGRGGAELWLCQLLEALERGRIQSDVFVHRAGGVYEQRVKATGASIFEATSADRLLGYYRNFQNFLLQTGPYDVVHSHLQLFSAIPLFAASRLGVRGRIAHTRNSDDGQRSKPARMAYRFLMRCLLEQSASHLLAVSEEAATKTFGPKLLAKHPAIIITGIDSEPFEISHERGSIRKSLGITESQRVIGHIGRFSPQKNHQFIVRLAEQVVCEDKDALFLLVGDGSLRPMIEAEVDKLGLRQNFIFMGERNDIPALLQAMDVFLLPSLYEGLPRVLLEAQLTGLPCFASNRITIEASLSAEMVQFLDINDVGAWFRAIFASKMHAQNQRTNAERIKILDERGFSIAANARELTNLYEQITSGQS